MKFLSMLIMALTLGLATLTMSDAEAAKRLGGGKSTGMQRDNTSQSANNTSPSAAPGAMGAAGGAAAAAAPKRSWMGPLAGIAAGLGLAALASHFGFGEELASAMMIGLAVMAVLAVVAFVMRKRALAQAGAGAGTGTGGMQYAGASAQPGAATPARPYDVSLPAAGAAAGAAGGSMIGANLNAGGTSAQRWPADFDAEGFARQAKVQFIRLQAAYDSANINDIREFTTPEMFAEIRTDLTDRGPASSANDVVNVNAQVLDVVEEAQRYIVSVRFTGLMRDTQTRADEAFDEVWHLTKPRESQGGWLLSGIQQMS